MRSISQLRDVLQRGAEHLKAALDCGVTAACLLLEDRDRANDQAEARIVTPAQGDDGELLTTSQLAKRLNYSTRTIQQFKIEGMPFVGEGRSTRFELSKALEWLRTHRGKNNRVSMVGNGKIPQAPIRTRLQAKRSI